MPTLGQVLINQELPEDIRDYNRVWDKNSVKSVMLELQKRHPDKYKDVVKRLYDIGHEVVTNYGEQAGISPNDFEKSNELKLLIGSVERQAQKIYDDDTLTDKQKNDQIVKLVSSQSKFLTDAALDDALKRDNSLGLQVVSGARGNKSQLAQSVIGDMLVSDSKGNPIPIPIFHGYGEGIDPAEYWASSYGARKGAIDIQKGTAKAGFFSKQMVAAAHRLRVTETDCGTTTGVPMASDDSDIIGTVTSDGRVVDDGLFRELKGNKTTLIVRSPLTCRARNGICSKCAGIREKGGFPPIGDNIGISAVQALCLDETTLVRMADGSSKPIRDIIIGDMVVGCSVEGVARPVRVLNVYNNGKKLCYETTFQHGQGIRAVTSSVISTLDHKILALKPSRKPTDINPVNEIRPIKKPESQSTKYYAKLASTKEAYGFFVSQVVIGVRNTYDIEVDHPDHLFMLANGLIVSNSEPITQSQLCLAEGTAVLMGDLTSKPIEEITISDYVSHYNNYGVVEPVKVVNFYNNGVNPCYRTVFMDKNNSHNFVDIISTLQHKIWLCTQTLDEDGKTITTKGMQPVGSYGIEIYTIIDGIRYYLVDQEFLGNLATYDIEVETDDHAFLLQNRLLVSNSSKHTGGVVGQTAGAVGGFDAINQLVQIPESFRGGATVATADGTIEKIDDAPQGGKYIFIKGQQHYVSSDLAPTVKVGDTVEAGDVISEGIPNPEKIVQYKGIGEGRKIFVDTFKDTLRNAGVSANTRNIEFLSRGAINHVEITDVDGPNGSVMGDVIEYDTLARDYKPRMGSQRLTLDRAKGRFLEEPTLFYSIGTKITSKVQKQLKDNGINDIIVNDNPAGFKPNMVRIMENLAHTDDWQTRMGGFYLSKGLEESAQLGATSKVTGNQSFIPALAHGKTFGTVNPSEGF